MFHKKKQENTTSHCKISVLRFDIMQVKFGTFSCKIIIELLPKSPPLPGAILCWRCRQNACDVCREATAIAWWKWWNEKFHDYFAFSMIIFGFIWNIRWLAGIYLIPFCRSATLPFTLFTFPLVRRQAGVRKTSFPSIYFNSSFIPKTVPSSVLQS